MKDINPVLESSYFINKHSKYVKVNELKAKEFAQQLLNDYQSQPFNYLDWSSHPLNPNPGDKNALEWILIVDCLNFSFWSDLELDKNITIEELKYKKYGIKYRDNVYQGYWCLPALINKALDNGIDLLNFKNIIEMDEEKLKRIFYSDYSKEEPYPPLLKERIASLKQTSQVMIDKFEGSVLVLLEKSEYDAMKLLEIIVNNFSMFNDFGTFEYIEGDIKRYRDVVFHKRAQIFIADVAAYYQFKGPGQLKNLDKVTMFADYRVPQSLLKFGILEYSKELNVLLNNLTLIEHNSIYEIEIRGNSIWAVQVILDQITKLLSNKGQDKIPFNAILMDYYLWEYAKHYQLSDDEYPIHRTRSIYY